MPTRLFPPSLSDTKRGERNSVVFATLTLVADLVEREGVENALIDNAERFLDKMAGGDPA